MKIGVLYRQVRDQFRQAGLATPELDAKLLVGAALNLSVSDLLLRDADDANEADSDKAIKFCEQRLSGVPVGRILGEREFFGRSFKLNSAMLEPRPDTEILVETVLGNSDPNTRLTMCDIGTGSGAIAVTLLAELPKSKMVAVDISKEALAGAFSNAVLHGVTDRFILVCADFAEPLQSGFDWVISNPPYIRTSVLSELSSEVTQHDPNLALDGGPDGLVAYRRIVERAAQILVPGGRIALEIGYDQANDLEIELQKHGFEAIDIIQDLGGRDRVATARLL